MDGKAELLGRCDENSTAGSAVEFGHDQSGHSGCFTEHLDLCKRVLAGRRVQNEQDIVGRVGIKPAEDAADLRQLVHQVRLVLEAPGGVDDQHVLTRRSRLLDTVEDDSGRVATFLAGDDRGPDSVAPAPSVERRLP